jgi:hypothetical protein
VPTDDNHRKRHHRHTHAAVGFRIRRTLRGNSGICKEIASVPRRY